MDEKTFKNEKMEFVECYYAQTEMNTAGPTGRDYFADLEANILLKFPLSPEEIEAIGNDLREAGMERVDIGKNEVNVRLKKRFQQPVYDIRPEMDALENLLVRKCLEYFNKRE